LHATPHTPAEHVADPFVGTGHACAHDPQFAVLVLMLISHPSDERPLQSANPRLHEKPQLVPLHVDVEFAGIVHAAHAVPQLLTLEFERHAPLQLWNAVLQVNPHVPAVHVDVPFAGGVQLVVHMPQCEVSVLTLISQPSLASPLQSAKPELHEYPHVTPLHVAVEFAGTVHAEHEPPHVLTLLLLTHAPPQL
jgi:hypothetical protein